MEFREAQEAVDTWIREQDVGYWKPLALLARLTEETGELAREVNHAFGEKPKKAGEPPADLSGEMGDILFVLACMANAWGVDLGEAFEQSLAKVTRRDATRWKRPQG